MVSAAQAGDASAQLALGLQQLETGAGGSPRYTDAFRWFSRAARSGDARGFLALGYLHGDGLGTPRNVGLARDYLERAREAGLPRANMLLAALEQALPPARRRSDPLELLREGTAAGDGPNANALGALLESQGNAAGAEQAYRAAEQAGSRAASQNLARLASLRERSTRSTVMRLADRVRLGDADAAFELAVRYHRGDGTPANYGEAVRYYDRAAAGGHAGAKRMLTLIASRPTASGDLNVAWLQELAANATADPTDGARPVAGTAPLSEPNPLVGLLAMRSGIEAPASPPVVSSAPLPELSTSQAQPVLAAPAGVRPPVSARVRSAPATVPQPAAPALPAARRF